MPDEMKTLLLREGDECPQCSRTLQSPDLYCPGCHVWYAEQQGVIDVTRRGAYPKKENPPPPGK